MHQATKPRTSHLLPSSHPPHFSLFSGAVTLPCFDTSTSPAVFWPPSSPMHTEEFAAPSLPSFATNNDHFSLFPHTYSLLCTPITFYLKEDGCTFNKLQLKETKTVKKSHAVFHQQFHSALQLRNINYA